MIHEEITQEIIGAAMAVLNELKPGLDEKLWDCFEKTDNEIGSLG